MPKVSIIIPIYNVEKYLRQSVDSAINQTLKDIEIICIDDCSTDNSYEILKEYAQKDSRIKLIKQSKNQGQGVARNVGLVQAQGEYVMFLDPDDWYELDACKRAYEKIKSGNNDFVIFDFYEYIDKNGKKEVANYRTKPFKEFAKKSEFDLKQVSANFLNNSYVWCMIFSRKFLIENDIKFAELYLCEDVPFLMKSIVCSTSVNILEEPLYNYRIRKTSSSFKVCNLGETIEARKIELNIVLNSEFRDIYIEKYINYCVLILTEWYNSFSIKKGDKQQRYQMFREFFLDFFENYGSYLKEESYEYKILMRFIQHKNYLGYAISRFNARIFSINKSFDCKRKIIKILGIKLSFKI